MKLTDTYLFIAELVSASQYKNGMFGIETLKQVQGDAFNDRSHAELVSASQHKMTQTP